MPETRIVTARLHDHPDDSWTTERYLATGGYDGLRKALQMTAKQFDAHVRLNYDKGDTVVVQVLRKGERLELKMKLTQ